MGWACTVVGGAGFGLLAEIGRARQSTCTSACSIRQSYLSHRVLQILTYSGRLEHVSVWLTQAGHRPPAPGDYYFDDHIIPCCGGWMTSRQSDARSAHLSSFSRVMICLEFTSIEVCTSLCPVGTWRRGILARLLDGKGAAVVVGFLGS